MKSKVLLCSSFSAIMLLGCGKANNNQSTTKAIIGEDDRVQTSAYADLVGAISADGNEICTGFISAPNQVTTAGHCVTDTSKEYAFKLANGKAVKIDGLANYYPNADVAVLNAKVGGKFLPSASFDPNRKGAKLIGYSVEDYALTASSNGSIESKDGILYHTLDTVHGSSGSPIIIDNKAVGVHIGYLSAQNVNVAVTINNIDTVNISSIKDGIDAEWGIKIPNMGGTIGRAIGTVTNPIRDNVTKPLANVLNIKGWNAAVIGNIANMVADNPKVQQAAGGWDSGNCVSVGGGLIFSVSLLYQTPICTAAGAVVGSVACFGYLSGSSGLIAKATCIQLCQKHELQDCK